MTPVLVLGSGGHARVVIDAILSRGQCSVAGILSDAWADAGSSLDGVPIRGPIDAKPIRRLGIRQAVIAIGDNAARRRIAVEFDALMDWATTIHTSSYVAPGSQVGQGTLVCAGAVVQPGAQIGRHAVLNTSCSVDHECVLEDFVQIGPGAHLGGNVTVRAGGFIGIGAAVLPGIEIGEWAVVGAGAVVTKRVDPYTTVAGIPARPIGRVEGHE